MKNQTVPRKASRGEGASQARLGWGSKVADSEPRPLLRLQGAKVALAKVSAASRKVRVQPHFVSLTSQLKMGRGKRAGHWRAVVNSKLHIDDGTGDWSGGTSVPHSNPDMIHSTLQAGVLNDFVDYRAGPDNIAGNTDDYFTPIREGIFHYALIAHTLFWDGGGREASGCANDGNEMRGHFIIAGGMSDISGNINHLASTFMHELGHTIGLHHGDPSTPGNHDGYSLLIDTDSSSYKSVMSYHYQLRSDRWPSSWGGRPNYSNGPTSSSDHDDWGTLLLSEKL